MSTPDAAPRPGPDRDRLDRILTEEGIATSDGQPSPFTWAKQAIDRGLEEAVERSVPAMTGSAPWVAGGVLLVASVLAGLVTVRLVRILRAPGRAPPPAGPPARPLPTPLAPPTRAAIDRHLDAGDAAAALAALWRWVAAHVEAHGFAHPDPARTNRELLAEVRRAAPGWERLPRLARLTNAVDGLLYGGEPLNVATVRALLPLADEVVA